jgi:hypothetical protein
MPLPAAHAELLPAETGQADWKRGWLFAFSAGVVITAIIAGGIYLLIGVKPVSSAVPHNLAPVLAEAWGPILTPNADVLVCVANRPAFPCIHQLRRSRHGLLQLLC